MIRQFRKARLSTALNRLAMIYSIIPHMHWLRFFGISQDNRLWKMRFPSARFSDGWLLAWWPSARKLHVCPQRFTQGAIGASQYLPLILLEGFAQFVCGQFGRIAPFAFSHYQATARSSLVLQGDTQIFHSPRPANPIEMLHGL